MRKRCHATAVLVVLLSAISMVGCSKDSSSENQPGAGQSDLYVFDSLEQMVATADLVVVGEVKGIKAGRVAGDPGPSGNGQIQFLDAQIAVENILKGEAGSDVTVEVDEFFLPFEEGTQGVFFLRATDSAPGHVLMSSTGMLAYDGDKVRSSNSEYTWTQRVELLSPDELEAIIKDAVAAPVSPAAPFGEESE